MASHMLVAVHALLEVIAPVHHCEVPSSATSSQVYLPCICWHISQAVHGLNYWRCIHPHQASRQHARSLGHGRPPASRSRCIVGAMVFVAAFGVVWVHPYAASSHKGPTHMQQVHPASAASQPGAAAQPWSWQVHPQASSSHEGPAQLPQPTPY
eukprot:1326533-Amphidinium_carterae.1